MFGVRDHERSHVCFYLLSCAPVNCTHAFPIPNYETIRDSSSDWDREFALQDSRYKTKRQAVVWRGSLSDANDGGISARWRLYQAASLHPEYLDVGFTYIPEQHNAKNITTEDEFMSEPDFQNYLGILDIDGNAWSSRFGQLLCYNSVVLKVEAAYAEHFYKDLVAWRHYVPIRADFSDLLPTIKHILDHESTVQTIASNARAWCRSHMVLDRLEEDLLDVWEGYAAMLDRGNYNWMNSWSSTLTNRSEFDWAALPL